MRLLPAAFLAALLLPSALSPTLAHAGRFTLGVSLGSTQSEADASADYDASSTAGLWLRAGIGKRFSADLEYGKISTDSDATRARALNLVGRLAVADLRGGTIHPMVLLALGTDSTATDLDFHHAEFGAAIELDVAKDFVVGADFRFGDRTLDAQPIAVDDPRAARLPYSLAEGSYRAGRVYLGVRL
ncbi:MAG: hypothetical protein JNK64_10100 [Myxococcales bacterium]|nr:hypothetical protein [Myxococcales bacterium]